MEITKQNISPLLDAFNRLYLSHGHRFVYLEQFSNGGYATHRGRRGGYPLPLVDSMIAEHLKGRRTYGVFANFNGKTPFMVFDFDFKDQWLECKRHCYAVFRALVECGIPEQYIHANRSGDKGVHLTIYFAEPIHYKEAKQLYQHVLLHARVYDFRKKIEFRPTPAQGVKLPLGKHQRTGRCMTFVDPWNLEKAKPSEYVLEIEQLPLPTLQNALERLNDDGMEPMQDAYVQQSACEIVKQAESELFSQAKSLKIYDLGRDRVYTVEHYERILHEGLQEPGTRHKITYQLCLFLKTFYGLEQKETLHTLLQWLNKQSTKLYTTPYKDAVFDTREIVADIYDKNRIMELGKKELTVTIRELETILTAKNQNGKAYTPKQKSVLFALLMHGKRYAYNDGTFYMTYKQITEATGMVNRQVLRNLIEDFTAMGLTAIHRSNSLRQGSCFKYPNVYSVLFAQKNTVTNEGNGCTVQDYTADTFQTIVRNHFSREDLRQLNVPRRQISAYTA